jgi:hypothetical protein
MANEVFSIEECRRRRKEVASYLSELAARTNLLVEQFSLGRQQSLSLLRHLQEEITISRELMGKSYDLIEKIRNVQRERE